MTMIPLEEAQARVLADCPPLHPRAVPLDDALGCVTSVDLAAEEAVPPFPNTAMDGFAVRAVDTAEAPVRLRVVATLAAGSDPTGVRVRTGEAVRIMTGAAIPDGADAIVMVELTRPADDDASVLIEKTAQVGDHIRGAGEDIQPGQTIIEGRTELGPGHLGVLASLGYVNVPVFPRARVGVLSTGDELVVGARRLRPGQIRDSNRPALLALLRQAGCVPVDLGVVGDDEAALTQVLERGAGECDAILTSGGVSVGDFDFVKLVLERLGRMTWMQVAIKPAKPFAFGVIGATPIFGLPGNPVSSMVSFELFARPALRQMMGHVELRRLRAPAVADEALHRPSDGKIHFVRVWATMADDGRYHVRSAGGQGSHQLLAMARANALAILPDGLGAEAGDTVSVLLLD